MKDALGIAKEILEHYNDLLGNMPCTPEQGLQLGQLAAQVALAEQADSQRRLRQAGLIEIEWTDFNKWLDVLEAALDKLDEHEKEEIDGYQEVGEKMRWLWVENRRKNDAKRT